MVRSIIVIFILCICMLVGFNVHNLMLNVHLYNAASDTMIKMPLVAWLLLSLAFSFTFLFVFKILLFVWRSPKIFSRSAKHRKEYKAHRLLQQGLSALGSGDYRRAEKKLAKGGQLAEKIGESPVVYYQNAAIAADRQNENTRRDEFFILAREYAGHSESKLALLTEAESHIANKKYKPAVKILQGLHEQEPRNSKILELLDKGYVGLEQWSDAWKNLGKLHHYLTNEQYAERKRVYAKGMLKDTANIETFEQLQTAWRSLPADIRAEKDMIMQYANSLIDNGHSEQAEKVLATQLKSNADLELVQAYSQLRGINFSKAMKTLESLENKFPDNELFFYCQALVAYRAQDLKRANDYVEKSLKIKTTPEAFSLWGQILEAREQPEAALVAYRQGVLGQLEGTTHAGELLAAPEEKGMELSKH